MNINLNDIIRTAVDEALNCAAHAAQQQRPIADINRDALCHTVKESVEKQLRHDADLDLIVITAAINSDNDYGASRELDRIVYGLKNGCVAGHNRHRDGNYEFLSKHFNDEGATLDQAARHAYIAFRSEGAEGVEAITY